MRKVLWRRNLCRHHWNVNVSRLSQQASYGWRPNQCTPHLIQRRAFARISNQLNSDPSFLSTEIDEGYSVGTPSEEAILERAKVHGISTPEHLASEAAVEIPTKLRRLLDDASVRQDLEFWSIILDYRSLKHGSKGIVAVLEAMLNTKRPVKLYADSVSKHIWRTIVPVVVSDEKLLYHLCQTGTTFMEDRPHVFVDITGQLLRLGNIRLATIFSTQYLLSHFRGQSDLIRLFEISLDLGTIDAINSFCHIISRLPQHRIYADTIPVLWANGMKQHAMVLHRCLLAMGDYPTNFEQIEPLIQEIALKNQDLGPLLRSFEHHGIGYAHQAHQYYRDRRLFPTSGSDGAPSMLYMTRSSARPKKLSDTFVARSFATRGVSLDIVLSSLKFFGLMEIGPLAVRELALAAINLDDLRDRFRKLDKMEIDLGTTNYVRVIRNLCMSGQEGLLRAILESDMHHEVFDDTQQQKRLLAEYYKGNQSSRISRTLAVLNNGNVSESAVTQSASLLLQASLVRSDWRGALMLMENMRLHSQGSSTSLDIVPIRHALRTIWTAVSHQDKAYDDHLDRIRYLVGFMQHAHLAGLNIRPGQWRSVLNAVGRSKNWVLFRQLVISIARLYQTDSKDQESIQITKAALNAVFTESMQSFMIEASLIGKIHHHQGHSQQWLRAARLLSQLKHEFQVETDYRSISTAFQNRLEQLFVGVAPGNRRSIIGLYLSCLRWVFSEITRSPSKNKVSSYTKNETSTVYPWDKLSMIFQHRSTVFAQRRKSVNPKVQIAFNELLMILGDNVNESDQENVDDSSVPVPMYEQTNHAEHVEDNSSVVFYADLLHPSYQANQTNKDAAKTYIKC